MKNINFKLDNKLHQEFKIKSIREKKNMKDILVELIEDFCKDG